LFITYKRIVLNDNAEHIATLDSDGNSLRGDRNYKLHLPPGIPASNFWSVIVYDSQTHLMIKTDQPWPSVYSSCKKLFVNQDGSVDVWFGPKPQPDKEGNWIQTIPGKGWNMILRLYEPLEAWVNGTWKPGEIEEMK
jgi:hypothetical protein